MIVRNRQFSVCFSYHLAVVSVNNEYGIPIPRLAPCGLQKLAYRPVGILNYLFFRLLATGMKPRWHLIGRMIADGKNGGKERIVSSGHCIDFT